MKEDLLFGEGASVEEYGRINSFEMAINDHSLDEQIEYCAELIVQEIAEDQGSVKQLREQVYLANENFRYAAEDDNEYTAKYLAHYATKIALRRVKNSNRLTNEKIRYSVQKCFERNRLNGTLEEYEAQHVIHQDQ